MKLVNMMAKACAYAQDHIDDSDAWPTTPEYRTGMLGCVSYQMACFLSQNTVRGSEGVDWSVVITELVEHPKKTEHEWRRILNRIAADLGGWSRREQ